MVFIVEGLVAACIYNQSQGGFNFEPVTCIDWLIFKNNMTSWMGIINKSYTYFCGSLEKLFLCPSPRMHF